MSEPTSRPSRAPEALKRTSTREVTRPTQRRALSLATRCAALVASCTSTLSDGAKSFYRASITDHDAARQGQRYMPRRVVAEWITIGAALSPWIQGGHLAGYGPARLRYAAELGQEIAARLPQLDGPATESAPAEAAPSNAPAVDVEALKRSVAQGLRNLGIEAKSSTPGNAAPHAVSQTLEELARAVHAAAEKVPADVMRDAGLTSAVVDALVVAAQDTLNTHTTAVATRTAARSNARDEDVLLGRLIREMRLMLASARTSQKSDPKIPAPRSSLLQRTRRVKAKTPKAPSPPVPSPT